MHRKKLTAFVTALLLALAAGCASKSPEPPPSAQTCPVPPQLPAWVIEAANGPSLMQDLNRLISPYGIESPNSNRP